MKNKFFRVCKRFVPFVVSFAFTFACASLVVYYGHIHDVAVLDSLNRAACVMSVLIGFTVYAFFDSLCEGLSLLCSKKS